MPESRDFWAAYQIGSWFELFLLDNIGDSNNIGWWTALRKRFRESIEAKLVSGSKEIGRGSDSEGIKRERLISMGSGSGGGIERERVHKLCCRKRHCYLLLQQKERKKCCVKKEEWNGRWRKNGSNIWFLGRRKQGYGTLE